MRTPIYTTMPLNVEYNITHNKSIEREIEVAEQTKKPIEATSPQIFTPKKDGVKPEHNIRTDRWDLAYEAMNKVSADYRAKRDEWIKSIDEIEQQSKSDLTAQA